MFKASLTPSIEEIPRAVTELVSTADPESIGETFTSLLGYYCGKLSELKARKLDILEGCKEWSVQAGGLKEAPFLSKTFLDKLGFGNMDAMDRARRGGFREPRRNAFAFRGRDNMMEEGESRGRDREGGFKGGRDFGRREFGRRDDFGSRDGGREFGSRDGGRAFGSRDGGREFGSRGGSREFGSRDGGRGRDGGREFSRDSGREFGSGGKSQQPWQGRGRVKDRKQGKSWDSVKNSRDDGGFKDHWNPF
jgi:ATP-dependent RNA helicase MSS116